MTLTLVRATPDECKAIIADSRAYAPVRADGLDINLRRMNIADTQYDRDINRGVQFAHVLASFGWKAVDNGA